MNTFFNNKKIQNIQHSKMTRGEFRKGRPFLISYLNIKNTNINIILINIHPDNKIFNKSLNDKLDSGDHKKLERILNESINSDENKNLIDVDKCIIILLGDFNRVMKKQYN